MVILMSEKVKISLPGANLVILVIIGMFPTSTGDGKQAEGGGGVQ